jgi:transposase
VQRAASGDVVALTAAERAAAIRLTARRGIALRQIADQFRVSVQTVKQTLAAPTPQQTDLLREALRNDHQPERAT